MYIITSFSGSSDARNNSCAMITFAMSSLTSWPRNTMRSLSRREKMSQPRSPRCVCSTTVGMMLMAPRLYPDGRGDLRLLFRVARFQREDLLAQRPAFCRVDHGDVARITEGGDEDVAAA